MQIGSPVAGEPILFPAYSVYNARMYSFLSIQVMLV